jgi:iron complex outermembrane receptor protein
MKVSVFAAVVSCILLTSGLAGPADASIRKTTNIPAESLSDALRTLAKNRQFEILYRAEVVRDVRTEGAVGELTLEEALKAVLSGTGLSYKYLNANTVTVFQQSPSPPSNSGQSNPTSDAASQSSNGGGKKSTSQDFRLAQVDQGKGASTSSVVNQTSNSQENSSNGLSEIIVTAQKRMERLVDVPLAVTVLTGDSLRETNDVKLEDYFAQVPGLVFNDQRFTGQVNGVAIRGLNSASGSATVGIYVDDSPYGGSAAYLDNTAPDLDPMDIDHIEVLRGPQGTLYGAGSIGGLIKFVTVKPDPSSFSGRVEVDGTDVEGGGAGTALRAVVNIPINTALAIRISGFERLDPGFITNAADGAQHLAAASNDGGRVALGWISDNWTITSSAMIQRRSSDGAEYINVPQDFSSFRPLYGAYTQYSAPGSGWERDNYQFYSLDVEGRLGWATLTSSTAYGHSVSDFSNDFSLFFSGLVDKDYGVQGGGDVNDNYITVGKFSQEIRLASPETDRFSWRIGAFYTDENSRTLTNLIPIYAATGIPLGGELLGVDNVRGQYEEEATFADVTYRLTPKFDIGVGGRYARNQQPDSVYTSGQLFGASTTSASYSGSALTYSVTPRYHLSDDTMAYFRLATGYRPGGPNTGAAAALYHLPGYGPDYSTNYELGLKSQLFDKRFSVDVALYNIDWTKIQVSEQSPISGLTYTGNGGTANSKGIEASFAWNPLAGLVLSGNVSYNDAKLTADLPPVNGVPTAFKGDSLPGSVRWTGALSMDDHFSIDNEWQGLVGASYRYVGDQAETYNFSGPLFPAYSIVDLRAGVSSGGWSATFFAKNVGNTVGILGGNFGRLTVTTPRSFGVNMTKSF